MNQSIYQSPEWEKFKLETGYSKSYRINDVLVLLKNLPAGFSMLYSPMVSEEQVKSIKFIKFIRDIKTIAKENKSIFYRLELDIPVGNNAPDSCLPSPNFIRSFEEMQPENNWLIDLTKNEDQIFTEMKQKGRYNLRIAQKNKIDINWSDKKDQNLDIFYQQYSETGRRHNISYRNKLYFDRLIDIFGKKGYARVYTASKDKTPLASAVMLYYNEEVLYLYGGSSDKLRNLMATSLLHWQVIKDAKKMGFRKYNFLGIAPDDNPAHPWAGITHFKKQFGGYQSDILGCFDLPLKPVLYQIFKIAEKARRK